ncbi:MAG TPA: PLP-dependent aminotransferase family protein [Thiolapillus brandeum]|uniref:PLP-dependent aminotransferase family protein n=1 Tax=Thiolapillus brandeum TaxID=1076588 RepID=A0A831RTF0_9GAMM|nr:PLP-dependent aminotransferase family protein [Thiolapillus brandeum]
MANKLYERVAKQLAGQIDEGLYRPGDRLPGVRRLARQFEVSISTIVQAQRLLEDDGLIEARPRSGYYVRVPFWPQPEPPGISRPTVRPVPVTGQELVLRLVQTANEPDCVQLGAAVPSPEFLPARPIQRALSAAARAGGDRLATYQFPPGSPELRRQIARRMLEAGCRVSPDDIVITSGCQEALILALRAVAKKGDVVAIESPSFYGLLQAIESLGMRALEIPTDPATGISVEALELALDKWPVKACVLTANFSNPLGSIMPPDKKQALVALLASHEIPLIEDDIYGDLGFEGERPQALRAYDETGGVIYCASFSKTLSPGLRVGWMLPGRWQEQIEYLKYVTSLAAPTLSQLAVADFLHHGGYDRHLRQVRSAYARQVTLMTRAVSKYFPEGTRVTQPRGGFVIWVELPKAVDALSLCQQALEQRISIAPGTIFSASGKYRNCIRLNCAQPWNDVLDRALMTVGRMADAMR